MKCDNCDENAFTILDLNCDKCGKRLCKNCSNSLKCSVCHIPYCECYGVYCPNSIPDEYDRSIHRSISWVSFYIHDRRQDDYWKKSYTTEYLEKEYQKNLDKIVSIWKAWGDDNNVFYNKLEYNIYFPRFHSSHELVSQQVVKIGKLTLELARFLVDKINIFKGDNEEKHRDADRLLEWYAESMKWYTIDQAIEIGNIILKVDKCGFWYA